MGLYTDVAADVYLTWKQPGPAVAGWDTTCLTDYVVTAFEWSNTLDVYSSGNYSYATAAFSFTRNPYRLRIRT